MNRQVPREGFHLRRRGDRERQTRIGQFGFSRETALGEDYLFPLARRLARDNNLSTDQKFPGFTFLSCLLPTRAPHSGRPSEVIADQLFRAVPAARAPQSRARVRRIGPPVWPPGELFRRNRQGKQLSAYELYLSREKTSDTLFVPFLFPFALTRSSHTDVMFFFFPSSLFLFADDDGTARTETADKAHLGPVRVLDSGSQQEEEQEGQKVIEQQQQQ